MDGLQFKRKERKMPTFIKFWIGAKRAFAGIPEYWIVDLNKNRIEVYRNPQKDAYQVKEVINAKGILTFEAFDLKIPAKEMLG